MGFCWDRGSGAGIYVIFIVTITIITVIIIIYTTVPRASDAAGAIAIAGVVYTYAANPSPKANYPSAPDLHLRACTVPRIEMHDGLK